MIINLEKKMQELVDKYVKAFKTDLDIDFKSIKSEGGGKVYLWILREHGTQLYEKTELKDNEDSICSAEFWLKYKIKTFRIKIDSFKDNNILGEIKEIRKLETIKELKL